MVTQPYFLTHFIFEDIFMARARVTLIKAEITGRTIRNPKRFQTAKNNRHKSRGQTAYVDEESKSLEAWHNFR